MNTKAFVNGLDPENTVKGYYDENDQLVMVEPEGSGGGGSETATLILDIGESSVSGMIPGISNNPPGPRLHIWDDIESDTFQVVLYEGAAEIYLGINLNTAVLEGAVELINATGTYLITGDCKITGVPA